MNASSVTPITIDRNQDNGITIQWSDNTQSSWSASQLRSACPCATCREKKQSDSEPPTQGASLPVLSVAEAQPLQIESMQPVGNYAYNIRFSDGHSSGVFVFELLRRNAQ